METHRIKMKIGVHEFEAEGPREIVTAQFDAFMSAVSSIPTVAPSPVNQLGTPITPAAPEEVSRTILDRVFRQGETLSLAALPHGDNAKADALLALLYGYLKLSEQQTVTGTSLMKSAKVSGVTIERVDRTISAYQPDFVLAAGAKKARRYSLNNRGLAKAEEVIRTLVQ